MSGSAAVNAKLMAWEKMTEKALEAAMDQHIKGSEGYAKGSHSWQDRTTSATGGLKGQTDVRATEIFSSIGHHVPHGVYLETRRAFSGRYRIIERARDNNLPALWARIRGILSGLGFGIRAG